MAKQKLKINLGAFDLAKGFGIVVVVLLHSMSSYAEPPAALDLFFKFLTIIAPGIMPMFLILLGYRFRETAPRKLLKKTVQEYLIPYGGVMLGYAIVYPIVMMVLWKSWPNAVQETMRFVFAFLLGLSKEGFVYFGYTLRFCAAAWFFLASFLALNLLNLIAKVKNRIVQVVLVCLCVFLGYVLISCNIYFYCIPQCLISIIYCYIGYCIKQYSLLERMVSNIWSYVILTPIAFAEAIWGYFDIASGTFNHFLPDCLGAACSGLLFMLLLVGVGQYDGGVIDFLKKIGTYSYWILTIHSVEMMAIPWIHWPGLFPNRTLLAYVLELLIRIVLFVVYCAVCKKISLLRYKKRVSKYK